MFFFATFLGNLRDNLAGELTWWSLLGFTGTVLFTSRFLVQWYVSERLGRSVIPVSFWYISIAGSLMMLVYAFHVGKLPFILAYLFPTVIYIRNLMLISKGKKKTLGSAVDKQEDVPAPADAVPINR